MICASISNNSNALRRPRTAYIGRALVAVMAIASIAIGSYFYFDQAGSAEEDSEVLYYTVASGPFLHNVVERGEVESADNIEVKSIARSYRTTTSFEVLWVIPEGSEVKEGDLLVRLDSSGLEEEHVRQKMDVTQSIASLAKAENEMAAAKIALLEYTEGLFKQEESKLKAAIVLAKETRRKAEEYYLYSARLAAKGYVTSLQLEGDRFAVDKAQIELEKADQELKVLVKYTFDKKVKGLDSDIKVAEADLGAAKERRLLEDQMLAFFQEQIDNCRIKAPQSGQVVHANIKSSRGSSEFVLEEGASVRERQTLIRLPDYDQMQVVCKINEARIALIKVGAAVTIKLDAYDDLVLTGEVTKVAEYPEPISYYSSPIKKYATTIKVNSTSTSIRPGLTSQVTIHVESSPDELQVPVQAIYQHGGTYYCFLKNSIGVEAREVKIGSNNSKFVVIKEGISANDIVARNPRKFLDQVDLPDVDFEKDEMVAKHAELDQQKRAKRAKKVSDSKENKPGTPESKAALDKLFSQFDQDANGILTSEELVSDQAKYLTKVDANGDGKVERKEFNIDLLKLADAKKHGGNLRRDERSQGASGGGQ
ncbi:MAG: efflux RND transporter periplasmic adaptor subunit [Pirellulales bacterium]